MGEQAVGRVIQGTRRDDDLLGTRFDDIIFGRGGWDFLSGRDGDDILDGGTGSDLALGGEGRDAFWGGRHRDILFGGPGADDFFFDTRHRFDVIEDFRSNDALVIDVIEGGFAGVRFRDVEIRHGARFDRLFVDGDYVAKVFGAEVGFDDIFLV